MLIAHLSPAVTGCKNSFSNMPKKVLCKNTKRKARYETEISKS